MPPVFNQVNLVVADMEATLAFYRRLGQTCPVASGPELVRRRRNG
jgi:catechol 2,3-dioxygenase-like lactoylglutathione lyase family enzyme